MGCLSMIKTYNLPCLEKAKSNKWTPLALGIHRDGSSTLSPYFLGAHIATVVVKSLHESLWIAKRCKLKLEHLDTFRLLLGTST